MSKPVNPFSGIKATLAKVKEHEEKMKLEDQLQVLNNILVELTKQAGGEITLPLAAVESDNDDEMVILWDKDAGVVKMIMLPDYVQAGIKAQREQDAREAEAKVKEMMKNAVPSGQGYDYSDEFIQTGEPVEFTVSEPYVPGSIKITGTFQSNSQWQLNPDLLRMSNPVRASPKITGKAGNIYLTAADGTQTRVAAKTEWTLTRTEKDELHQGMKAISKKFTDDLFGLNKK